MEDYLESLVSEFDNIEIVHYDIANEENFQLLQEVADVFDIKALTPTVVIGGLAFTGYGETNAYYIRQTIDRYSDSDYVDITNKIIEGETILVTDFDSLELSVIILPFIGEVEIRSASLGVLAVVLGFLDGFNPCAMWVLIFLITMTINLNDRKRMWAVGLTFIITSALVYALIMVSWLTIAATIISINIIRILIGCFAVVFGGFSLYRYFRKRKEDVGCEVTTETKRTRLIERMKKIVSMKSLWLALLGTIVLAVSVNVIELACSTEYVFTFTASLAANNLSVPMYFLYIGIYIFMFMLDDLVIFAIAMFSMKVTGISNRYARYSHLVGGIIMVIIGILLVFFPNVVMFNF